jgi:N-acetylmuramoyl-L-alanine amidase
MRSFAKIVLVVAAVTAALGGIVEAQSARGRYTEGLASETRLRRELDAHAPSAAPDSLLRRIRTLVEAYERMSREFPASGYMDNALWQGAMLAADAFRAFGEAADRTTAIRMFSLIEARFPTSSLVPKAAAPLAALADPPPAARPAAPPAVATTAAGTGPAELVAIRRDVLPDALRITLDLGREVPFRVDRLDGPPRVFVDLEQTRAVEAIRNATIQVSDTDIVTQVRLGQQDDGRTRVVMDLAGPARHSVYALYDPYRVVIDFIRPGAAAPAPPPEAPAANGTGGFSLSRQLGLGVSRIVIDPGHGGHDPGAKNGSLTEASVVLDVALRLEQLMGRHPGVEVILTRRDDTFVPLEERTAIANREKADLFLSIHANASARAAARGVETYFLNLTNDPDAERVAARENAASALTMGQLSNIVETIALNNKIDESRDFAGMIQRSLYAELGSGGGTILDLGVKQAPCMVLLGATMPSVLAEISFITNRDDAALMRTADHRQRIAEALYAGVLRYQQALKASAAPAVSAAR